MPCYYHETEEERDASARERFRHNSDVAEMLCRLCKTAEILGSNVLRDPAIAQWWKEHKARDKKLKR